MNEGCWPTECRNRGTVKALDEEVARLGKQIEELSDECRLLREYKEHHEFVMAQASELSGQQINTVDDYLKIIARLS